MTKSWPAHQKIKGERVSARPGMTEDSAPPTVKDAHNLRFQGIRGGRVCTLVVQPLASSFVIIFAIASLLWEFCLMLKRPNALCILLKRHREAETPLAGSQQSPQETQVSASDEDIVRFAGAVVHGCGPKGGDQLQYRRSSFLESTVSRVPKAL